MDYNPCAVIVKTLPDSGGLPMSKKRLTKTQARKAFSCVDVTVAAFLRVTMVKYRRGQGTGNRMATYGLECRLLDDHPIT